MKAILSIVRYTFLQQFRNRLYLVVILFGFLITAASLLFGAVAADQEIDVILDLGLATTELFGLVMSVFGAVTLILEEMESRTIYLILTRPLPRSHYVLGRFFGLLLAVVASMSLMGIFHAGLLLCKGWEPTLVFFISFPFMFLKVMMATGLALFFSLWSTSAVSSIVFTVFFWMLGHFGPELSFLAQKSQNVFLGFCLKFFLFVMPNLQLLNFRDAFDVPGFSWAQQSCWGAGYALAYTAACLALSLALFSRKEF